MGKITTANSPQFPTWARILFPAIVFVVGFLFYAQTINYGYAWDDEIVIQQNEAVQKGLEGVPELWEYRQSRRLSDQYGFRPVVLTSYALEIGFFGSKPQVSHFVNVVSFALLCLVIFVTLTRLFGSKFYLLSFVTALVFAAHPIHVETVANIKGLSLIHI